MYNRKCSKCDMLEDDAEWMIDVRVIVSDGEEGFADIKMYLCEDHFDGVRDGIVALGFVDHRHGGINFLEDGNCPGCLRMNDCPTPSEYGEYTIGEDLNAVTAARIDRLRGRAQELIHEAELLEEMLEM